MAKAKPEDITILKPIAILVEGMDEFYFILNKIKNDPTLQDIQLFSYEGDKRRLDDYLSVFISTPNFETVKAIGIICDAETSRTSREASLDIIIKKHKFKIPIKTLIMPHDKSEGCLENAMLLALKSPHLLDCANEHIKCTGVIEPNANHFAKKQVHAIIGANEGAKTLGETSLSGLWDWTHPSLKATLDFISQLQEQAS